MPYDFGRLTEDPQYNVLLGSQYLSELMDEWGGNAVLVAAAYNAGSGNVRRWIATNGDPRLPGADVVRWIEEIPFSETRNYVQRVLENTVVYDALNPSRRRHPHLRLPGAAAAGIIAFVTPARRVQYRSGGGE